MFAQQINQLQFTLFSWSNVHSNIIINHKLKKIADAAIKTSDSKKFFFLIKIQSVDDDFSFLFQF